GLINIIKLEMARGNLEFQHRGAKQNRQYDKGLESDKPLEPEGCLVARPAQKMEQGQEKDYFNNLQVAVGRVKKRFRTLSHIGNQCVLKRIIGSRLKKAGKGWPLMPEAVMSNPVILVAITSVTAMPNGRQAGRKKP
ncbi:MAG: hypothetical protein M0Z48_10470, partial [Nitrospiraceae bacterium]|nr:hypothetical protein [Nitrospiraceae bacterium]